MMEFDVYSDELAECMYMFIDNTGKNEEFGNYRELHECSIAEFVKEKYLCEFREYCVEVLGYRFID